MLRYIVLILIVAGCGGNSPPIPDGGVDAYSVAGGDPGGGDIPLGGDLAGTICPDDDLGSYCGTIDGEFDPDGDYYWFCQYYPDREEFIREVTDCLAYCKFWHKFYRECRNGCDCY